MSALEEMPCRELVEVITDYLDGTLAEADRIRFEEHLANCPPCSEYVAQFRLTIELAGRVEPDQLSDEALAELEAAFRGWHRHP